MLKRKYDDRYYLLEEASQQGIEEEKSLKSKKFLRGYSPLLKIPKVQQGVILETFEGDLVFSRSLPVTQDLKDYEILVQNKYVGLNHVDWKSKKYKFNIYSFPWINGRESSGIVVKCGSKVDQMKFPIAAEVFLASTSYRNMKSSTFQEYTVFDSRLVWRLPQYKLPNGKFRKRFDLAFAAGIGVALVTAGSAISSLTGLDESNNSMEKKYENLAIWGGSSSVGLYVIQLAKASKKFDKIIVISAKKHEGYLKELGANFVVDRFQSETNINEEILQHCPTGVNYGVDVISKESATILSRILEKGNERVKKLVCVVGTPEISTKSIDINSKTKLIVEAVNIKKFHEDLQFGTEFVEYSSKLFEAGLLKPIKSLKIFKTLDNFGEGIKNGLKELEEKGASAEKFIASL